MSSLEKIKLNFQRLIFKKFFKLFYYYLVKIISKTLDLNA